MPPQKKKKIPNPRRLLILTPTSHSPLLMPPLLHTLTGHRPAPPTQDSSFAGYTTNPPLRIENRYYTAEVPVWVDEIPVADAHSHPTSREKSTPPFTSASASASASTEGEPAPESGTGSGSGTVTKSGAEQWAKEFSSDEARVVRDAIGAVVICLRNPAVVASPLHLPSHLPGSGSGSDPTENRLGFAEAEAEEVENRADFRNLKSFINAICTVRSVIEEERGGEGVGDVPVVLVLGEKNKKMEKKKKKKNGSRSAPVSGRISDGSLGAGLDTDLDLDLDETGLEMEEPFSVPWWEDRLCEMGVLGVEVVRWDMDGDGNEERNQFGELQGIRRVKEILETHEWGSDEHTNTGDDDDDDDLEKELLGLSDGFNREVNELEREMVGLRLAIGRHREQGEGEGDDFSDAEAEGDEELRVDAVEALLMRMRAIKDMSDELPAQERKKFAAKAVRDIMKEI